MELPEIRVNIWRIVDKSTFFICQLAARAYAIGDNDSTKEKILQFLAHTDHHLAKELPVLKEYKMHMVDAGGSEKAIPVEYIRRAEIFKFFLDKM